MDVRDAVVWGDHARVSWAGGRKKGGRERESGGGEERREGEKRAGIRARWEEARMRQKRARELDKEREGEGEGGRVGAGQPR